MPAPAKRDRRASAQPKFLAVLIHDREVAFHAQWAVIENCDFCASQGFLRKQNPQRVFETFKDNGASGETQASAKEFSVAIVR
jgi:hypothetical protein